MKRAVVLLSGGLDSATTLAICAREGFETYALSFAYGQRHEIEIGRRAGSRRLSERTNIALPRSICGYFGGSALTDEIAVPKDAIEDEMKAEFQSPTFRRGTRFFSPTRWPGRRCSERADIFIGVNAIDYSGYPDCRPEFIAAFENLANLATKAGVEGTRLRIHAPLLPLSKAEIIERDWSSASIFR